VAIYKLKPFARFARSERIADAKLIEAVERAGRGLVDADLGGGLIKQRIARQGQGRRGGYRVIIGFRSGDFAVFLFGFAKSAQENLEDHQLQALRRIAGSLLGADAEMIKRAVERGELMEIQP
jgi:hypothetical protein